jgi:hypothetical protein
MYDKYRYSVKGISTPMLYAQAIFILHGMMSIPNFTHVLGYMIEGKGKEFKRGENKTEPLPLV